MFQPLPEDEESQFHPDNRSLIQNLVNEYHIILKAFKNLEYLDYCQVKGACQQTIPLVLFLPVGLFLGVVNIIGRLYINITSGLPIVPQLVYAFLQIIAVAVSLYILLKACEIIPKLIKNPLLFGRITTITFGALYLILGVLIIEIIGDGYQNARTYHTSQFWIVFAFMIWQRVLSNFIYDYRLRAALYVFLYVYYGFKVSSEDFKWIYVQNLIKVFVYISLEMILSLDIELKNLAQYQLENNISTTKAMGESFTIPPITMDLQPSLLEQMAKVHPFIIFDKTKELLHISRTALSQLKLEIMVDGQIDLLAIERRLRKMEVVEVFNVLEPEKAKNRRLQAAAKFGSTCGTNSKGELLHSLINGPTLQQLRGTTQQTTQRLINYSQEGIIEELLNGIVKGEQDNLEGIISIRQDKEQTYFKFTLASMKGQILMTITDVTKIYKVANQQDTTDIKKLCQLARQLQTKYDISTLTDIQNIESKIQFQESLILNLEYNRIDLTTLQTELEDRYKSLINSKFSVTSQITNQNDFYSDKKKLLLILDNLVLNAAKGPIKISIIPLPNGIQFTVQDTGQGINLEQLNYTPLQIANQFSKILGNSSSSTKLKGNIANKGLRISGNKISFWIRNMAQDNLVSHFLIDEDIVLEENEMSQEAIMERYLQEEEQSQYLPRIGKQLRYCVLKYEVQEKEKVQKRQPKLAGMMKLQESGRMKKIEEIPCTCRTQLLISRIDLQLENSEVCSEDEAISLLMTKKMNPCGSQCQLFSRVMLNCLNPNYDYQLLVSKIQGISRLIKLVVLSYSPYGDINQGVQYKYMPEYIIQ